MTVYLETEHPFPDLGNPTRWLRVLGSVNGAVKQRNHVWGGMDRQVQGSASRQELHSISGKAWVSSRPMCLPGWQRSSSHLCTALGYQPKCKNSGPRIWAWAAMKTPSSTWARIMKSCGQAACRVGSSSKTRPSLR